jgi:hypothetical protein
MIAKQIPYKIITLMNNQQLKHIVSVLNSIAVAQFAVFGYTGLTSDPVQWLQIGLSSLGFLNIQFIALWVLSFSQNNTE